MTLQMVDLGFERDGRTAIVTLSGDVDMSNAALVRRRIAEFVTSNDDAVILDLSSLSFIDSAGLHAVVELGGVLGERRQQIVLSVAPGSQVERAIEIVGIPRTFPVHPDRGAAMEAARVSATDPRPFAPGEDV